MNLIRKFEKANNVRVLKMIYEFETGEWIVHWHRFIAPKVKADPLMPCPLQPARVRCPASRKLVYEMDCSSFPNCAYYNGSPIVFPDIPSSIYMACSYGRKEKIAPETTQRG